MSHNYLFETYDYIARRLADVETALISTDADDSARQYAAGQVDALCEIERFLVQHYDIKLPRRLRNSLSHAATLCRRMACDATIDLE